MGVESAEPVIGDDALALNFTNEGGYGGTFRLLKNVTGLWLVQESLRQWQREGHTYTWDALLQQADDAEPLRSLIDPDAPEYLSPGDLPAAIRASCRRTGQPEPDSVGALVRCCLESLALKHRWVFGCLERLVGHRLEVIRMVGGGSQNGLLCQYTADACQRPVVAGPVEATALGNLVVQAIATGHLPDLASGRRAIAASVARRRYEPGPGDAWLDAYERFHRLLT
jgi:rhamnulokinase